MSHNLKITVYNNRDYEQAFTLEDSNGDPLDLTNCQLVFGYGSDVKTLATHISGTTTNKCVYITDAVNGAINFKLPYSVLKTLEPATYAHDLVLIDSTGKREGLWQGQLVVKKGFA